MRERLLFILPYLLSLWLITFLNVVFLLGFRWIASEKYAIISDDLRIWENILPILFSVSIIAFSVYPRLKNRYQRIYTLHIDNWFGNGFVPHLLLMCFISSFVASISQRYFSESYGELILIKSLDEVVEHPRGKFFKIDSISYNPYYGSMLEKDKRSFSKNPKLSINHYITHPLHDSRKSYYKPPLDYWLGWHTRKSIAVSFLRKDTSIQRDISNERNRAYDQMDTYNVKETHFLQKISASSLLDNYKEAIEIRYGKKVAKSAIVFEPKSFPFDQRFKNPSTDIFGFIVCSLFLALILLIQKR